VLGLANISREAVKDQRKVETVEDFKLRIAAIIGGKLMRFLHHGERIRFSAPQEATYAPESATPI